MNLKINEDFIGWFILVAIFSFIPVIARYIATVDYSCPHYDIKDVLFGGLALLLSNIPLISNKKVKNKIAISAVNFLCLFIISFIIGSFMSSEINTPKKEHCKLELISFIFVGASIILSFICNRYIFKKN